MKKLRLLLFPDCNRKCVGCCNKQWNLEALPECNDFRGYSSIMLTGGKPMLHLNFVKHVIREIRKQTQAPIYMYTAKVDDLDRLLIILSQLDGLTVTLHEQTDVKSWLKFSLTIRSVSHFWSLRLNVFSNIDITGIDTTNWKVKDNIEWIDNCPLPEDEVFMKLRKQYV